MDQRQALVDELNVIVPVNVLARQNGQISLYAQGGAVLLDGSAVEFEFTKSTNVGPETSVENGLLSGLSSDGRSVSASSIAGGALAAQFEIRDELAVSYQRDLDTIALDLATRFAASETDPTLADDDPGLFTDRGARVSDDDLNGLSARLTLNSAVDPTGDGDFWRLRDGLSAVGPADSGAAAQLNRFVDALDAASDVLGLSDSAFDMFAGLTSKLAGHRLAADEAQSFAAAHQTELERLELEQGVDTDAELQRMMIVEQAYAANARLIQTVDDMMQSLLRI
jgi:flagellar hook-associated protein 1 FlgK